MKKRRFGKLNIEVSGFGLGCMRFPTEEKDGKTKIIEENAINIIRTAIDNGVNYIDTAYVYGDSEDVVGKALCDGYREKVYLATKLPVYKCQTKEDFYKYFNEQLKRLQTDHIDFYLAHSLNLKQWERAKELGIIDFFNDLKEQKKITYACFSFHDNYDAFEHIINDYDWDMCQIQFNFMDIENQAGLKGLKLAGKKDIPVVIMEGLLGGRLASAPEEVAKVYEAYPVKRRPVEWAFRYLANFKEVATVLSGVKTIEQLLDDINIFNEVEIDVMSEEELALIEEVRTKYKSRTRVSCTGCNYCMPCPQGIEIPKIFRIWNGAFQYQNDVSGNYSYRNQENTFKDCIGCLKCISVCPQQLKIPALLKEADKELK